MPAEMENSLRSNKSTVTRTSSRHKRSGYEPSDTETEWQEQESPWHGGLMISNRSQTPNPARTISHSSNRSQTPNPTRTISPLNRSQRHSSKEDANKASRRSPGIRRHSRSPYKPLRNGEDAASYMAHSDLRRNTSPYKVSEHRKTSPFKVSEPRKTSPFKVSEYQSKHVSPYRVRREESNHETGELVGSSRKQSQRTPSRRQHPEDKGAHLHAQESSSMGGRSHKEFQQVSRVSERSNYNSSRSMSAPKPRAKEREQQVISGTAAPSAEQRPSPISKTMIHKGSDADYTNPDDINERIANMKLSKSPSADALLMQSTESVSLGDIFISRDCTAVQKESAMKNGDKGNKCALQVKTFPENNNVARQFSGGTGGFNHNPPVVSVSTVLSQTNNSSSAFGRYSNGRSNTFSNKLSDSSGKLSGGFKRVIAIRQRSQTDGWLSCVRGRGSCTKSKSQESDSPDSRAIDESSFIERALVVEELRPFWADKHRPRSLSKFICHKQQTQLLKQLVRITTYCFLMHVHY